MLGRNWWLTLTLTWVLGMTASAAQKQEKAARTDPANSERTTERPAAKKKPAARKGLSAAQVLAMRFDRSAPQVGDSLPDVTGFDEQGREFPLSSLTGHYSVLVFGCLT